MAIDIKEDREQAQSDMLLASQAELSTLRAEREIFTLA